MRHCLQIKVRNRARMRTTNLSQPANTLAACSCITVLLIIQIILTCVMNGEVFGGGVEASGSAYRGLLSSFNLGAFTLIYSVLPQYVSTKSIRHGKEVQEPEDLFSNSSVILPFPGNQSSIPSNNSNPVTIIFSSRTLQVSSEENNTTSKTTTISPSEELERNLDSDSSPDEDDDEDSSNLREIKEFRKRKRQRRRDGGNNRLKRQMGMAAEIALIAPTLQTMGCIPKFFCGLNSKAPNQETTALNDLAYLIKFAMLDDDDSEFEDPLFSDKAPNQRGKDGLTRIKEDLIIENMAEDELIQEDPANLPFVMQDMEDRIVTKTKPGNKLRLDQDMLDAIIVEPEQSTFGSFLTGIKSVFRIGRKDNIFGGLSGNYSSQVTPRSERTRRSSNTNARRNRKRRMRQRRWKKQPFWTSSQFRQDMELAQRIGKADQDDAKCSTTFNVCPYTINEMMDIVHGGYQKKRRRRRKKKPQFYVNAEGPPEESSEEVQKPFKDPENLVTTTTTTPKTWLASDPESQIFYAIFPHKAVESGITTIPTTRRPVKKETIGPTKKNRRPPNKIQGHVEYEHDEEGSLEMKKPEHLDILLNNKYNHNQVKNKPSWWSSQQRPPPSPGRRPAHHRPQSPLFPQPPGGNKDKSNDDDRSSSEEKGKTRKKNKEEGNDSESAENDDGSSEEKNQKKGAKVVSTSPQPPIHELISIVETHPASQQLSSQGSSDFMRPLQPVFQNSNPKHPPIAKPRPKYKIERVKPKKGKKNIKTLPAVYTAKSVQEEGKSAKKSKEESEEEEGDEESQETSSEEKSKTVFPIGHTPNRHQLPNINGLRGRPSEEIKGSVPQGHRIENPRSVEDDEPDNSDEDPRNSHSAPNSNEMSRELARIPSPARPPPPHLMRSNGSSEYSDEHGGRPQMRPISYSYFQKRPRGEPNGQLPIPPPQGPPEPAPTTTTQKYSTGFLGFLFGNNNKKKPSQKPPVPLPQSPNESQEDDADDVDDDDDDDDASDEQDEPKRTITGPSGQFEVGHLGKPPPKSLKPNFTPPQKPARPYNGATSMEDSDEKRSRTTPSPPQDPESPKPVIQVGNPYRFEIPAPATPPPRNPAVPLIFPLPPSTSNKKTKGKTDESEEEKQSEESKEDDESKETSSEEKTNNSKKTTLSPTTKVASQEKPFLFLHGHGQGTSLLSASNFVPNAPSPVIAVSRPILTPTRILTSTVRPLPPPTYAHAAGYNRKKPNEEKQNEDSNQTKEDDSGEEAKASKETGDSEEENNSSEEKDKKPKPPLQRKRKPEDDELESPAAQFPPLPPVVGDINAVGEILGQPEEQKDEDEDIEAYGSVDNIPAPPPLALQGFASSLEIVVPTKAPPIRIPALNNNPISSNNYGGQPGTPLGFTNPGAINSNGQGGPAGGREPGGEQQFQQFVRNPGSSSSNRGPSGNQRPQGQDQNNRNQQGNKKQEKKKEKENENSSEEKNSSEENQNKSENEESSEENVDPLAGSGFPTNQFDEAILSLGLGGDDEDNGDQQGDSPGKLPPPPPPVFVGGTAQKQQLQNKPFLPRPVPLKSQVFYTLPPGFKREPILKNQLPHQLPQMPQFQQQAVPMLSLKPSAAAALTPIRQPVNRPPLTNSFSVSHLLRPLLPRPMFQRKPVDPKVVQWIRETYGIPEVGNNDNHPQDPNRTGLQSEGTTTSTTPISFTSSKKRAKAKVKVKAKPTKNKNKSVETIKYRSAERVDASEEEEASSTTTTSTTPEPETSTATESPTTTTSTTTRRPSTTTTKRPTTTTKKPTTTTTRRASTVSTRRPTTTTTTTRRTTTKKSKLSPDYITEDDEAKMAQALFNSSEEEESEEAQTKSTVRTKVGNTKLTITVKSVRNNTRSTSSERPSASSERATVKSSPVSSSSEKTKKVVVASEKKKPDTSSSEESEEDEEEEEYKSKRKQTIPGKSYPSSSERKKTSSPTEKGKTRTSLLAEKIKLKHSSVERSKHKHRFTDRRRSSAELTDSSKLSKRKSESDLENTRSKLESIETTPKPKPKPIKLPPIFGKHARRKG